MLLGLVYCVVCIFDEIVWVEYVDVGGFVVVDY